MLGRRFFGFVRRILKISLVVFDSPYIVSIFSYTVRTQSVLVIFTMSVWPAFSRLFFSLACLFCSRSSRTVRNESAAAASSLARFSSRTFLLIMADTASRWDSVLLSAWVLGAGSLESRRWRPRCDWGGTWFIDGWYWRCGSCPGAAGGRAAPPAGPNWCWWWSGWPDEGRP